MKICQSTIAILVALLSGTQGLMGQWVHTFESYRGSIRALGKSETAVYAGARGGGIFRSTDDGLTWNIITSGEITKDILSIAANDSLEFAGTDGEGIFCHTMNGSSWTRLSNGIPDTVVNGILIAGNGTILIGTEHGVLISINAGKNWTSCDSMFAQQPVLSLVNSDSGMFAGTGNGVVYSSPDSGNTWKARGGIPGQKIVSLDLFRNKLFAGTADSGVFVSTDDGLSWTGSNDGLANLAIAGLTSTASNMFAGTWTGAGGAFVSDTSGNSWTPVFGLNDSLLTAILTNGTTLYASSNNGVFRSTDNGASWSKVNLGGITNYYINAFAKAGANIFAGTAGGGVLRSTDLGESWSSTGANYLYVTGLAGNDSTVLAGAAPGIWRSNDNGVSWSVADSDWNGECFHILFHDSTFYAAYGFNIHVSYDRGATWHILGLPSGVQETANDVAVIDSSIFVGTGTLGVYRSTNTGTSWAWCRSPENVYCMTTKDTMLFIGTTNGVYRSSNDGSSWTSAGLSSDFIYTIVAAGGYLFAGTDQGLFCSVDNGSVWSFEGQGLNKAVEAILIDDSTIFAGTRGDGVLSRALSDITLGIGNRADRSPLQYGLSQNYPNPFNPTTIIDYELPAEAFITLTLYDILGRPVRTLIEGRQSAGNHSVMLDGGSLSSGVYFCRMEAGSYVQTRKLVLLR